jgi:hypothetical protein
MAWHAFNLAFLAIAKPRVKHLLGTSVQEPEEIQEFSETVTLHLLPFAPESKHIQPCSLEPLLDIPVLLCPDSDIDHPKRRNQSILISQIAKGKMKSWRKQRSASVDPPRATPKPSSAREKLDSYNHSYHGQASATSLSSKSNRNLKPSSKTKPLKPYSSREATSYNHSYHGQASATSSSSKSNRNLKPSSKTKPSKPYSSREATLVSHDSSRHSNPPDTKPSSFKSSKSKKSDRRLEFQKTHVQHTQEKSSKDIPTGGDSVATGDVRKRLSSYRSAMGNTHVKDPNFLVPLLAAQAYHIPGNSWGQDWRQFMANNHPLFGIFLHHKLHPIKSCTRIVALVGSIVFGLVLTNIFYLFYVWNPEFDQTVLSVTLDSGDIWTLTTGMLLLWTLGGSIHASFNLCMWYIAACSCCRAGGCFESRACCPSLGKHLIRVLVLIIVIMAILVVLMRTAIGNADSDSATVSNNETETNAFDFFFTEEAWDFNVEETEEFHFVLAYLVQMVLSLFVYYPLFGTILMTGVLGCGKVPILGGRPYEVAQFERKKGRLSKMHDWEMSGVPTIVTSGSGSSGEGMHNHSFISERDSAHEDDIEIIWASRAKRDFDRK